MNPIMFSSEQQRARYAAELEAGKAVGCVPQIVGVTVDDQCVCFCGWKSPRYSDGAEFAHRDWVAHIVQKGANIVVE